LINIIEKNKVVLTPLGKRIFQYLRDSLNIINKEIYSSSESSAAYKSENILTLGVEKNDISWVLYCLKDFSKINPGLTLSIISDDFLTESIMEKSDIIFYHLQEQELKRFNKFWYLEYKHGLYASQEYITKYGEPTLDNISWHKIIAYSGLFKTSLNWHLHSEYGLPELSPSIFSQSPNLILKMTMEGLGIGALAENKDLYSENSQLIRIIKHINGPVLKNYFCVKNGLSNQMMCNIDLVSNLFLQYFRSKSIVFFDMD
ncbi:MAG: hypothetical protein LBU35_02895, partial [Holosporales bacterium]|nr:hypothetical protein [Holosporales bacterium]